MLHQPAHFFTLVEAGKDAIESIFQFLQEHRNNVFLHPDRNTLERYTIATPKAIIVLPLVSEAPSQEVHTVNMLTLEKLIVDVFCEPDILIYQTFRLIQPVIFK
jgi:hypothetical protein